MIYSTEIRTRKSYDVELVLTGVSTVLVVKEAVFLSVRLHNDAISVTYWAADPLQEHPATKKKKRKDLEKREFHVIRCGDPTGDLSIDTLQYIGSFKEPMVEGWTPHEYFVFVGKL